jgi:hypothetical protein
LTDPHVEYVAHHWILLAGPAFLPAVIVVGVVLYIAIRDRRRAGDDAVGAPPACGGRSDAEERRMIPAGDDAERSDAEERRTVPAADDDKRSHPKSPEV